MKKKYISPEIEYDSFTLEYNLCVNYGDTDDPEFYRSGAGVASIIQTSPTMSDPWDD